MSQDKIEIVKRAWEAWHRDDLDANLDLLDPDVELHTAIEPSFEDLGESVLALGELKIIGQTSQVELTTEFVQLLTFRGGKIASSRDFLSHAEGLKAAGLGA
jgi:ketosteroid isomerase-like protein